MSPNILLLFANLLLLLCLVQHSLAKFSAEFDPMNQARLMQRRHLVRSHGIHKEKLHANVHNGYLQWEKDKFHETLGEKILPKSARTRMDPKFLGSVEPRLLKSTAADGTPTKSDSEEQQWRDWLRRHFLLAEPKV